MRRSLILCLTALFVLAGMAFGQDYEEVFTTDWIAADQDGDGNPDLKNIFMSFLTDFNGDGKLDFSVAKSSDIYYTDWSSADIDFYGSSYTPIWSLNDISVAPLYMTYADMDGDGNIELVFTGRDAENTQDTSEMIRSLVEVYEFGSSDLEWDLETDEGVQVIGLTGPSMIIDDDDVPDLFVSGDTFWSFDTYVYRSNAADTYEVLWQSQGAEQTRTVDEMDYDFDGDYEFLQCDYDQQGCELKLYDYDPAGDRMVRDNIWYREDALSLPSQCLDLNGDGSTEILLRCWDGFRGGYNLSLINGDTEEEFFSYGEDLTSQARAAGAVFWNDGFGSHDLDMDGNPDLLYYTVEYDDDGYVSEGACYVVEYEGGSFVERFAWDPDPEINAIQVYDLDGDGVREICIYTFHSTTTSYTNSIFVFDPMNNYQEKFSIDHSNVQPIPYYAPVLHNGVDLDGDGHGEIMLRIYERVSETTNRQSIEIYDGATGELDWVKEYSIGTNAVPEEPRAETEYAGYTYLSSDFNGNGKIEFAIGEHQFEDEELLASRFTIYEFGGETPPVIEINVEVDKSAYQAGDLIQPKIGGKNTGSTQIVDVYIAFVYQGAIYCAPTWAAGVTPWISNFEFPGGFELEPSVFFDAFSLPCDTPPINVAGEYWFAGALTPPGVFEFLSLDYAVFNFGS
ncbi:MAG: hypothetical protein JW941_00170 [Candidatus Coatesbacteria bacterium]|nr:hypothetical protein [Candidatus Coatesbacteria bacterium]